MSLWYIGALLAVTGSIASNLGVNIQKYSFLENSKKPREEQLPYTKQSGWALGLALVIGGSLGDFAALALAAQSIVAPIGSMTLVANMVFAHFWLKETLSRRDMLGTVLIIAGSVLTVAFGEHESPKYSLHDFRNFFGQAPAVVYAVAVVGLSSLLYGLVRYVQPVNLALIEKKKEYDEIKDRSERDAAIRNDTEYQSLEQKYSRWCKLHPFAFCSLSGILGAQSVLFGKMVSALISTTFQGDMQLGSPFPYVFLICMLAFVLAQIHFLALALTYFDALYCVPIFQCFFILVSTIGGAAFFQEFSSFSLEQSIIFPLGIFITLSGVALLAQRNSSSSSVSDVCVAGEGHRIIPASTATFFVDAHRQKMEFECRKIERSRSHNFLLEGNKKSKVQQEKDDIEAEANKAARLALKGQMKLPQHVEQSVLREISTLQNPVLSQTRHDSLVPITVVKYKRLNSHSSHHHRAESTQPVMLRSQPQHKSEKEIRMPPNPNACIEGGQIGDNDDCNRFYTKRKMKSRSHPTHWPSTTSINPAAVLSAGAALSDESEANEPASPSLKSMSMMSRNNADSQTAVRSPSPDNNTLTIPLPSLARSQSDQRDDKASASGAGPRRGSLVTMNRLKRQGRGDDSPLTQMLPSHQEVHEPVHVDVEDSNSRAGEMLPIRPLLAADQFN